MKSCATVWSDTVSSVGELPFWVCFFHCLLWIFCEFTTWIDMILKGMCPSASFCTPGTIATIPVCVFITEI